MTALATRQFLDAPLFAVCGQNVRKVREKVYGPNDLASKETQTDDIFLDEKTVKKLQRVWKKLKC